MVHQRVRTLAGAGEGEGMAEEHGRRSSTATRGQGKRRASGAEGAAEEAARCLGKLTGRIAEGCSEVTPTEDDGWLVSVDVVEVARIPDTTSLMATYEVQLAGDGTLRGYRRVRRYCRGVADS
jgi:hypothetical protein